MFNDLFEYIHGDIMDISALNPVKEYILSSLDRSKKEAPLVVGLSGAQGSGKSTLVVQLIQALKAAPHNLRVVGFSLDDFYKCHKELVTLAETGNTLWQKRGLPGTHDVELCQTTIEALIAQRKVEIPVFDKSLFSGSGDRAPHGIIVEPPYDVILIEGWCVGFNSLCSSVLESRYSSADEVVKRHKYEYVEAVNNKLKLYKHIWSQFDCLVLLRAKNLSFVYQWRLQQEHQLISQRGSGMTDAQVRQFVDMYMPAYKLWLDTVPSTMVLQLDEARQVVSLEIE